MPRRSILVSALALTRIPCHGGRSWLALQRLPGSHAKLKVFLLSRFVDRLSHVRDLQRPRRLRYASPIRIRQTAIRLNLETNLYHRSNRCAALFAARAAEARLTGMARNLQYRAPAAAPCRTRPRRTTKHWRLNWPLSSSSPPWRS